MLLYSPLYFGLTSIRKGPSPMYKYLGIPITLWWVAVSAFTLRIAILKSVQLARKESYAWPYVDLAISLVFGKNALFRTRQSGLHWGIWDKVLPSLWVVLTSAMVMGFFGRDLWSELFQDAGNVFTAQVKEDLFRYYFRVGALIGAVLVGLWWLALGLIIKYAKSKGRSLQDHFK